MSDRTRERMDLLTARFVEWLAARNYAPKTRVNYGRDVGLFLTWVVEQAGVETIGEVTDGHVQRYQMALYAGDGDGRRMSVGTQACRLSAVRTFFEWLVTHHLIARNPAAGLRLPKRPDRLPRELLTEDEARLLLESTPARTPRDARDRAMLEVLYATGLRRAELLGLSIYDLDVVAGTLRVERGKGGRGRVVPLTGSAMSALRHYLDKARPAMAREASQTRLFVSSRSGGPLDDADVVRIVAKAARRAGLNKHVTPHTLRHACATHLLRGQADIRQIQKLLGHRRLSSTEVYTRVEIGDLAEVVARCHPRARPRQ